MKIVIFISRLLFTFGDSDLPNYSKDKSTIVFTSVVIFYKSSGKT